MPLADLLLGNELFFIVDPDGLAQAAFGLAHQALGFFGRDFGRLLNLVDVCVDCGGPVLLLVGVLDEEPPRVMSDDLLALRGEELHEIAIVILDLDPNCQELHLLDRQPALLHGSLGVLFAGPTQQHFDLVQLWLQFLLRALHDEPLNEARA